MSDFMSMKESFSQAQKWMAEFSQKSPDKMRAFQEMAETIEKEEGESLNKKPKNL